MSVTLDPGLNIPSDAPDPDECVEHAEGDLDRDRSVAGEMLRPGVRGAPPPGDCPYWCVSFNPCCACACADDDEDDDEELFLPLEALVHRGGHAVAARAPDRVHVTSSVPV